MKSFARFFALFFLIAVPGKIFAQESGYYIRNYLPKEYKGFNQMWEAVQDKNGLLFFAGTSKIFIYDGNSWENTVVKPGAANRQIAIDSVSGTIYVGAVGEFGYLDRDATGKWKFISLVSQLAQNDRVFSDVWKIFVANGNVYFQSSERIFVFKDKKLVGVIEGSDNKGFALAFLSRGHLYVRQRNVGLEEISGTTLHLLPGGDAFAAVRILGMLSWKDNRNLVLTGDDGFVVMNSQPDPLTHSDFSNFPQPADTFLLSSGVLGIRWVNDSIFAVFSRSGIGFYGTDGKLREVINKNSGLNDESIAEILIDREHNIWLMTNNGLSRIAYNSPANYYTDKSGFNGSLEFAQVINGKFYIGTSGGLWVNENFTGGSNRIHPVKVNMPQTETWQLFEHDSDLLVCTSLGLYRLRNQPRKIFFIDSFDLNMLLTHTAMDEAEEITDRYTNRIVTTPVPGELITAEKGGIGFMILQRGQSPQRQSFLALPGNEVLHISPVDTVKGKPMLRDFWVNTRFRTTMHIVMNIGTGKADIVQYDSANGIPDLELYPVKIGDSLYLVTMSTCYRYVPAADKGKNSVCFFPAPDIFMRLFSGDISAVRLPFDNRLLLARDNDDYLVAFGTDEKGKLMRQKITDSDISANDVQYATVLPGGIMWEMSDDLLVRVDLQKKNNAQNNFMALIREVTLGDSLLFSGSGKSEDTLSSSLAFRFNSLSFRFAAPYFDHEEQLLYSYMLDGYDTAWSKWNFSSAKSYTNLPEGAYTFRVKAKNTYGKTSAVASYSFTILPPWYRTGWAYVFYVLAFGGSFYGSVRLSARRLLRQKEKLETTVRERTAEVVEQKQKIELQKSELELAYTGMRDSIHYAQRIQDAILPVRSEITKVLPECFVFFRPRDIVSGDFYWFARMEKNIFIACVDCTGHGVPGAFMSMIGNTLLNEIVLGEKMLRPDEILGELNVRVRQALHQDKGGETQDGMDIALCVINTDEKKIYFSGANRPMWMIRKNELKEFHPDKFPIAGAQLSREKKFTLHTIELHPQDCFYLSTDGYADQFGGDKGKKFMVKKFRDLLLTVHALPFAEQEQRLENHFVSWKGELEQVDDVLVIGFRYIS